MSLLVVYERSVSTTVLAATVSAHTFAVLGMEMDSSWCGSESLAVSNAGVRTGRRSNAMLVLKGQQTRYALVR